LEFPNNIKSRSYNWSATCRL